MKRIQNTGLILLLVGLTIFTSLTFLGSYELTQERLTSWAVSKEIKSTFFLEKAKETLVGVNYDTPFEIAGEVISLAQQSHDYHVQQIRYWEAEGNDRQLINAEWSKVLWLSWYKNHKDFTYDLLRASLNSPIVEYQVLFFLLTFGFAIIGSLMWILPNIILLGGPGIKNDGVFHQSSTNAGWVSKIAFTYLVVFYVVLYFYPDYIINQVLVVNPISEALSGQHASQWFLYGFMYCVIMSVMAIRMYVKYRHNRYQLLRTTSVLFFQIAFAFLIPELLVRFNMPWYDFKNAWPLDYDFFYAWSLDELQSKGGIGMFILVWGILLTVVLVPLFVYLYGKRWYCSWVCGCGGLAETLGDPYRQLSDKRLNAWKVERWLINGVFVFAFLMTLATLYAYFTAVETLLGIAVYDLQSWYGFLIGSIFAGVVGTGFYPVMGNRVWCRFGCPLAAYMGLVQRFKSRFRITTNGGQCISCGNCSTYCEQGIDVRWYAQRQQNIVRSSCVGCGICSAVCPRGVLKLENGPEEGRFDITNLPSVGNQKNKYKNLR